MVCLLVGVRACVRACVRESVCVSVLFFFFFFFCSNLDFTASAVGESETFNNNSLQDGTVICRLINALEPSMVLTYVTEPRDTQDNL